MTIAPEPVECPRCQRSVDATDRFCRVCGFSLAGRPDFRLDLYQTMVEAAPIGIFTLDAAGRVRYWNRMMEDHTRVRRRDALGRNAAELLPQLQPFTHRIMRVFDTAVSLRLDPVTHSDQGANELTESFWFRPIVIEDGSAALLATMEDITQKMRVDNQLIRSERLAAIGELAAGVAHNFNNILAAIGGDAQLLKLLAEDEKLPCHVSETAQQIYDETMRGGRIAHDLLSFARGVGPQIKAVHVAEVVQDAVRLIRHHPAARAATLETVVGKDLPRIEADPDQLHQVFFNLMLNALQAMPGGGILTISASVREDARDHRAGILDVKFHDTGAGIPRDHLKRIFDPFFSRRANGTSGSGLGLPVSLAMIKSIGGDIQVASAEGIGTTATVSLPIVERRSTSRDGLDGVAPYRILVADDDANVRRTMTTLLTRRGFEVVAAIDAEDAAERFEQDAAGRPFSVVVTELVLPKGDAVALTRRIRAVDPEAAILILTGVTDPQRLSEALESGAQFGFSKPPNFRELLTVIEELCRTSGAGPGHGGNKRARGRGRADRPSKGGPGPAK